MVTADGGMGIPVRVDHTDDDEVAALFDRVRREKDRLDVLAIVMTGQPASWQTFLDESPTTGRHFVESWIWPQYRDSVARSQADGAAPVRARR